MFDVIDFVCVEIGLMVGDYVGVDVEGFVFWVEDYPFFQVVHCFYLVQHVCAADAQGQQGVEVFGVEFYGVHETGYGFLVLVVLLEDAA